MKKSFAFILLSFAFLVLSGCADSVSFYEAGLKEPVGFLHGVWHGCIVVFAWIGSLFVDDIAIYAIYNTGGWYDFGFMLGISFFGGAAWLK